ncbi:MAG: redoxin family protein [bacterium]|nr:redoxin family protein [bacterium]
MRLRIAATAMLLTAVAACGGSTTDTSDIADLPPASTAELTVSIQAAGLPAVVNVWASWCGPCRSEAPLLATAASQFEGSINFIGLNTRDSQPNAKGFIAEFLADAPITHLFDRDGDVVIDFGGTSGVPLTFFVDGEGAVSTVHFGVIDERTLALAIDELLQTAG